MTIQPLTSDEEIERSFAVMNELRPHLKANAYLATIRAQEAGGYRLVGRLDGDMLVAVAGYRFSQTLFRGPHLFVDDLVTAASAQGRGHGTVLLAWLGRVAKEEGFAEVWLDSRATAKGFYAKLGFDLRPSIPCSIAAEALAARWVGP